MKKSLLYLIPCLLAFQVSAQRYTTEMFSDVTVTTDVTYGQNFSVLSGTPMLSDLNMDIYEPVGDAATDRYLIILAHAGSFLPQGVNTLPFGTKSDSSMVELCTQFARRGWVAASIDYRLGWNPIAATTEDRASSIINAVYRAMQDMKTAVRFFRMDEANGNTYGIDPTRVAVGGSNSGGFMALAAGALNSQSELELLKFLDGDGNSFVNTAATGGFDGEGGSPMLNMENHVGFSSNPQLVLNLGGAIADTSWQNAGEAPIVNLHGVADPLTPYSTAVVIVASTQQPIVEVSGGLGVAGRANRLGNADVFINENFSDPITQIAEARTPFEGLYPFPGLANGFEPWSWYNPNDPNIDNTTPGATGFGSAANPFASKAKALAYIDTIMEYFNPRAVAAMQNPLPLGVPLGTDDPEIIKSNVKMYPNPAVDQISVETGDLGVISSAQLTDLFGRIVRDDQAVNRNIYRLDRNSLPDGIYFLSVEINGSKVTRKVVFN